MNHIEREELAAEYDARYGDPRTCPAHPGVKTSSGCGSFDAPCWKCECEMEEAEEADRVASLTPEERAAEEAENARLAAEYAARLERERELDADAQPF